MRCDARPASPPPARERGEASPSAQRGEASASASVQHGRERFENLLRDKARAAGDAPLESAPDADGAAEALVFPPLAKLAAEPVPDAVAAPTTGAMPGFAPAREEAPPAAPMGEAPVSVTVAALQAAARADAPPAPLALAAAESAEATWEVSVSEPLGVQVELRATRLAVPPATGGPMPWSLHVACPTLDRAALARHASRLDARLRGPRGASVDLHFDDPEGGDDADA